MHFVQRTQKNPAGSSQVILPAMQLVRLDLLIVPDICLPEMF
jgi:hypothetical protein